MGIATGKTLVINSRLLTNIIINVMVKQRGLDNFLSMLYCSAAARTGTRFFLEGG